MTEGVINVYKEAGWTSNDVVCKLKGVLHQKRIGHAGTLDPDACGVLPVCVGRATKLFDYLTTRPKTYVATICFGAVTDTQDASGKFLEQSGACPTDEELERVLGEFLGKISQIPPMYSALKRDGKKLYEFAREGKEIVREAREVFVYDIKKISDINERVCKISVTCSKGTYIRTICHDIGQKLGCGAYMLDLLRIESAGFKAENAITIAQIQQFVEKEDFSFIVPIQNAIEFYPRIEIDKACLKKIQNGNKIEAKFASAHFEGFVRAYCDGKFFGIAEEKNDFISIKCMLGEEK